MTNKLDAADDSMSLKVFSNYYFFQVIFHSCLICNVTANAISSPPSPTTHTYTHICKHAHTAHHVNGCSPQHFFAAAIGILIHSHKEVHEQGIQRLPKKKSMIKGWVSIQTFLEQGGREWGNYGLTALPGLYVQRVFDVLSGNISRQHLSHICDPIFQLLFS